MMKPNKLTTACAAALLALGLAACSSDSGPSTAGTGNGSNGTDGSGDRLQMAINEAVKEAQTAMKDAEDAYNEAVNFRDETSKKYAAILEAGSNAGGPIIQSSDLADENARTHLAMAKMHVAEALKAKNAAMTAYQMALALSKAEDPSITDLIKMGENPAKEAKKKAVEYRNKAEMARDAAEADHMNGLWISNAGISRGDTTIPIGGGTRTVLVGKRAVEVGEFLGGVMGTGMAGTAVHTLSIGDEYLSGMADARLKIVNSYLSTKMVSTFEDVGPAGIGTKKGMIKLTGEEDTTALKQVLGPFYRRVDNGVPMGDAKELFSYGEGDDKRYVWLARTRTTTVESPGAEPRVTTE